MSKPNYLAPLLAEAQRLKPGVHMAHVMHDDWCDQLNGRGTCNCEPEIKIREVQPA